jgi:hypothetical protein
LQGDYEEVVVTHCTLDPGGAGITTTFEQNARGEDLKPTTRDSGHVKRLVVTSSIVGGIMTEPTAWSSTWTCRIALCKASSARSEAVSLSQGKALVNRCTILGRSRFHSSTPVK